MSVIDVEKLLQAVSDEAPCGDNLDQDTVFQELEIAAATDTGESMLDKDADPVPPKWADVAKMAGKLLTRTKDLRVAMHLTRARLNTDGVIGLADGLTLLDVDHTHAAILVTAPRKVELFLFLASTAIFKPSAYGPFH